MTIQQVEELGLKARARPIGVEVREERILGVFEDERRIQASRQPFGQHRLAHANRALESDVADVQRGRSIAVGFSGRQATDGML